MGALIKNEVIYGGSSKQVVFLSAQEYANLPSTEKHNKDKLYVVDDEGSPLDASVIPYDNEDSGLVATNVQDAIDEVRETISNPNLLDNPWFTVNQRGQSSWSAGFSYGVDRWLKNNVGTIAINNGLTTDTQNTDIYQRFEEAVYNQWVGKTMTLSIIDSDGNLLKATGTVLSSGQSFSASNTDFFISLAKDAYFPYVMITFLTTSKTLKAVKLELGSISTLALDTAPNYVTELLKCQRYFQRIGKLSTSGYGKTITTGPAFSSSTIWMPFELSVPMRTHPVITITGRFLVTPSGSNQKVSDTEHTLVISVPNFIETDTKLLNIALDDSSNPFTVGGWYKFATYVASEVATMNLSADL